MPQAQFSVRISSTGSEQVKSTFAELRKDGVDAQDQIAGAAEKSAQRAVASYNAAISKLRSMYPEQANAIGSLLPGADLSDKTASELSAALRNLGSQEADLAGKTRALQMTYDPLAAAQIRYTQATKVANDLLTAGRISTELHAKVLAEEGAALALAKKGLDDHSGALGLNRAQYITAQSAVLRFTDAVIAGRNPMTALALEGHKLAEVVSEDEGGIGAGLKKVGALLNPTTLAIAAVTGVVVTATAAWDSYAAAVAKLDALAQVSGRGLGLSGSDLEAGAEAAAKASNTTVGAAREIETEYVKMGGIGRDVLTGLTSITTDFAAATGQDAKGAAQQLGQAFQDPAKGAEELATKYNLLTAAQVDEIDKLVEQNRLTDAQQKLFQDIQPKIDGAAEHLTALAKVWTFVKNEANAAWTAMGRAIDSLIHEAPLVQQIQDLTKERDSTVFPGYQAALDAHIKQLQQQLDAERAAEKTAQLQKQAPDVISAAKQFTGEAGKEDFSKQLSIVNDLLTAGGKAAGYNADQLGSLKTYQDALTHATTTYISEARRKEELDANAAAAAATRDPATKARLAAERSQIENAGKLVTSEQAASDAISKGDQARSEAERRGQSHAEMLAREAAAMEVDTRETLKLADAYVQGGGAALIAEARRKALTQATKQGADLDSATQRQLALDIANVAKAGGERIEQLNEESTAREKVLALYSAGAIGAGQLNDALSDEAALRPLLIAQMVAQGTELTNITAKIEAMRGALARFHADEEKFGITQAIAATDENFARLRDQIDFAGDNSRAAAAEIARRAAQREASDKFPKTDQGSQQDYVANKVAEALAQFDLNRKNYITQTIQGQQNSLALSQRQLELVGANDNYRQAGIDKLQTILGLNARRIPLDSDEAKQLLANVAALDQINAKLKLLQDTWSEVNQAGDQFLGDVLNPDTWSSWGNAGKVVLRDLENEFIKLTLLNPLKNKLFGESNPTLSSIFSLFGGGSAVSNPNSSFSQSINALHDAAGTDYSSGGATWLAENGPELVNLPRGATVTPASQTQALLAANNNAVQVVVEVAEGQMFEARVKSISGGQLAAAAPGIAAGGSTLAQGAAARRVRYSLRGR